MKSVLIANYHKPYPPRDGADGRCIDLIRAFQSLGYKVILFSSDLFQQAPWTDESITFTEHDLNVKVFLYFATDQEKAYVQSTRLQWNEYVLPTLKDYFTSLYKALQPEIVLINYVFWANLATGCSFKRSVRIIDAIDLLSLNQKMASVTIEYLNKGVRNERLQYQVEGVNNDLLKEDFFSTFSFTPDEEELALYDTFDITIAINPKEEDQIRSYTSSTKCIYLPFSFTVNNTLKTYTSPPVFAIGPNQFNFQGYLYFVHKVLPAILVQRPDFVLHVIGDGCKYLEGSKGIDLLGFVPDLQKLYSSSKFAICPLIGATGQQLKVMEAMANGLPVVVLRNVAERCPIIHNQNGLIADNALEFANYTLQLYSNPDLCNKLGMAARATIEKEFTSQHLSAKLKRTIDALNKGNKLNLNFIRRIYWHSIFIYEIRFGKYQLPGTPPSFGKRQLMRMKRLIKRMLSGK